MVAVWLLVVFGYNSSVFLRDSLRLVVGCNSVLLYQTCIRLYDTVVVRAMHCIAYSFHLEKLTIKLLWLVE